KPESSRQRRPADRGGGAGSALGAQRLPRRDNEYQREDARHRDRQQPPRAERQHRGDQHRRKRGTNPEQRVEYENRAIDRRGKERFRIGVERHHGCTKSETKRRGGEEKDAEGELRGTEQE